LIIILNWSSVSTISNFFRQFWNFWKRCN